ncbi:insulinase family protein [Deinococcus irradiatisoli]|uniref:Insulinase family protein n=1 Tax=Deinococcus irradiatisoli TaxID=2202254 RepID=A0A2Z3JJ95_9DEIO|nr:pitrilysin family protein [Deinococcus irradiatisoli]AWN22018.1 insulinase family protein [Deinococcus irradiatisoli]
MPAHTQVLASGLTVAFERRATPGFSFHLRLPLGSAHDPPGQEGTAGLVEEWLYKGAGGLSARAFQDALDDLGVRRGGGIDAEATAFSASGLGEDLNGALTLFADLVRRPALPESEVPVLLDLARQDLAGFEDSPAERLGLETRRLVFGESGFAHPSSGTPQGLEAITPQSARAFWQRYGARGSILSMVADREAAQAFALAEELFGDWGAGNAQPVAARPRLGQQAHLHDDSQQTHFTLTGRGISPLSPDWFAWHLALTALSGGSASRLFHAVREERGLAYAAHAGPQVVGGEALLSGYAASTPERAPETLEVMLAEVRRWQTGGLTPAEFERARTALLASTVFGSENIRARSGGMARDLALFGQVREAEQLRAEIGAVTLEQVNAFLGGYDPGPLGVVSLGPVPLVASGEVTHV